MGEASEDNIFFQSPSGDLLMARKRYVPDGTDCGTAKLKETGAS